MHVPCQGCPTFLEQGPLKWDIPWEGNVVNFSWLGPQHQ